MRWLTSLAFLVSCKDVSSYSTGSDHYEGSIVAADFVRSGVDADVKLCLTLDTNKLQDAPGMLTSSDNRFRNTPLRPVPQIWHDALSTLSFGEGRTRNLLYVANEPNGDDIVIVSLMTAGGVEVRLLRGAPGLVNDAGIDVSNNAFGIFELDRVTGPCLL